MNSRQMKMAGFAFLLSNVLAGLDGTIVATALPAIVSDLHGIALMSWIITAYMLFMAVSAPIWTKLSERFGQKTIMQVGTTLFILGSVIGGFAGNIITLIIARAIIGIGAGAMLQLPFVIYGSMYAPAERRLVIGRVLAAYSMASIVGPLLGGWFVDIASWRATFFISLPIGILMMVLVGIYFKQVDFKPNLHRIDVPGALTLALMVISLMMAMQSLSQTVIAWHILVIWFVLALISGIAWWQIELHAGNPIVPLHLFKNRSFISKVFVSFFQYGFFGFYTNYLPTWSQGVLGTTATVAGFVLIPSSIAMILYGRMQSRLEARFSEQQMIRNGLLLMIFGGLVLVLTPHSTLILLLVLAGIFGLGTAMVNNTIQVATQEAVAPTEIGAATALNSLIRTLGTTMLVSTFALAMNRVNAHGIQHTKGVTTNLMNKITDATAARQLSPDIVPVLRNLLHSGLTMIALLATIAVIISLVINWKDPWQKPGQN
ncbi:MFS transporter [Periweissella cryptocerci]|nr:MFS transporter [Periweissella cryptocerci]